MIRVLASCILGLTSSAYAFGTVRNHVMMTREREIYEFWLEYDFYLPIGHIPGGKIEVKISRKNRRVPSVFPVLFLWLSIEHGCRCPCCVFCFFLSPESPIHSNFVWLPYLCACVYAHVLLSTMVLCSHVNFCLVPDCASVWCSHNIWSPHLEATDGTKAGIVETH